MPEQANFIPNDEGEALDALFMPEQVPSEAVVDEADPLLGIGLDTLNKAHEQSKALDNYVAGLTAFMDTQVKGAPTGEAFLKRKAELYIDPSRENVRKSAADIAVEDIKRSTSKVMETLYKQAESPEDTVDVVSAASEAKTELEQEATVADVPENFMRVAAKADMEYNVYKQAVFQVQVAKDALQLLEKMSLGDKVVNIAGLFLSDLQLDMSRWLGSDFLDTPQKAKDFFEVWQEMDVEEKQRLYPQLKEAIHDATSKNNYKTAFTLLKLIDPDAADEIKGELYLDDAFLAVDVTTLGASIATRLAKLAKMANVIRAIKKANRAEEAAAINNAALKAKEGSEVLEASGIDKTVAQSNATPFNMEKVMPEAADGLSPAAQKQLATEMATDELRMQGLLDETDFTRETAFTSAQKARVEQKALEEMEALKEQVSKAYGWVLEDVRITERSEDGFKIEYKYEGVPSEKHVEYDLKLSDIGVFDSVETTGVVKAHTTSPNTHLSGLDERLVGKAINIDLMSMKIQDKVARLVKDITKDTLGHRMVHRKRYRQVDDVLLAGDEFLNADGTYGKVYTPMELMHQGIETARGTVRLDAKQAEAYYRLRHVFDKMGVMKNSVFRRQLKLEGNMWVMFEGVGTFAKPYVEKATAWAQFAKHDARVVYDPRAAKGKGGITHLDKEALEKAYDEGYQLVRFREAQDVGEASKITHALVKASDIADLPAQVIHLKKAYVPRFFKESFYFVKEHIKGVVDNVPDRLIKTTTVRMFNNKKDAEVFLRTLQKDNPERNFEVLTDREMSAFQLTEDGVGQSGGFITSARASKPIPFGLEGTTAPRVSAFESLQREIQRVSNVMPRNEWRLGMQEKWINTAMKEGLIDQRDFNATLKGSLSDRKVATLAAAREFIRDQMRIPTTEERWFEAWTRSVAEWAERPVSLMGKEVFRQRMPEIARKSLHSFAHKDPFALARTTAFHSMLGFFGPVQFYVQAQGASIAMSLFPELAPKAVQQYSALRPLMYLAKYNSDMATVRKMSDNVAKAFKLDKDELWNLYEIWRDSGFHESTRSTADYAAAVNNFGVSAQALRSVLDKGLVFYTEGELVTRGISLSIARSAWLKKTGNKTVNTKDINQVREIIDHATDMQLRMHRANRARWQKGFFSLGTQFLQSQTKYFEHIWPAMFGGKSSLSGFQKFKLASMQALWYGSAGVPMGNWIVNEYARQMGIRPEDVPDSTKAYLRGGVLDMFVQYMTGAQVDIGKRGGLASGLELSLKSLVYESDSSTAMSFLGAFGGLLAYRGKDLYETLKPLVTDVENTTYTGQEVAFALTEALSMFSSVKHAKEAVYMATKDVMLDSRGNIVIDKRGVGGFSLAEILAVGAGFNLATKQGVYDLDSSNREHDKYLQDVANALMRFQTKYFAMSGDSPNKVASRNMEVVRAALLKPLSYLDREKVNRIILRRLEKNTSKEAKAINDFYNKRAGEILETSPWHGGEATNPVIPYVESNNQNTEE